MQFTEWIAQPNGWEHLVYHPLSKIVEFGVGIDIEGLADHMKENGYDESEPVVIWRDKILDGRHKHAAAIIAGVVPTFTRFIGKSAEAYVAKKAFRQHLNTSQRAMIAATIASMPHGGDRKTANLPLDTPKTNAEAAEQMNVAERTIRDAKKVVAHGTDALNGAVMDGTISASDAAKVVDEPANVQNEAVKKVRKKKAKTVKAAVDESKPEREPGEESQHVKDEAGFVVPFKALQAFDDAKTIGSLCRKLDAITKEVEEIGNAAGGRLMHTTSQIQTLRQVRKSLWQSRATHVCPYCKGEKKTCEACKSSGWMNKTAYENAPESVRKEMEIAK